MITLGIDEAGRGSWAGPLVVGAAILSHPVEGLKDSKLLTKIQRQKLYKQIIESSDYGIGWVMPKDIDNLGLTKSTELAIRRALAQIKSHYDEIIIDGSINFIKDNPKARAVVKADNLFPAVSAASILAKVSRDEYMYKISKKYSNYGFEKHVGYGTSLHKLSIIKHGVCEHHRLSYKPIQGAISSAN